MAKKSEHRAINAAYRVIMRLFLPDLLKQLEMEGLLDGDILRPEDTADKDYIRIFDNGADTTIFSFSGLDALYAGLARYEFSRAVMRSGVEANYVFLRDNLRTGFFVRPDGGPGGYDFYEAVIHKAMEELDSTYHVALGSSIGGASAMHFGTRCGMDQLLLFGATITRNGYSTPGVILRSYCNLWNLIRDPRGYFETNLVILAAQWAARRIRGFAEKEADWPEPIATYRKAVQRPLATLFYGVRAYPDARHAAMMAEFPEAVVRPLQTGRHNTPAFLTERGELGKALAEEIHRGRALKADAG